MKPAALNARIHAINHLDPKVRAFGRILIEREEAGLSGLDTCPTFNLTARLRELVAMIPPMNVPAVASTAAASDDLNGSAEKTGPARAPSATAEQIALVDRLKEPPAPAAAPVCADKDTFKLWNEQEKAKEYVHGK